MTYFLTALLITIALGSVMSNFPEAGGFIFLALAGIGTSWWQGQNLTIRPLKPIAIALLFMLTARAILPFFTQQATDILSLLIKTWIYTVAILSFIIYSPRDHCLIQALALGLVVYSCFWPQPNAAKMLFYILAFFATWIVLLRKASISPAQQRPGQEYILVKRALAELKINLVLLLGVAAVFFPLYLLIPRLDLHNYLRLVPQQKFSTGYADFPRKGLVSFLSRSKEKLTQKRGLDTGAYTLVEEPGEGLITIDPKQARPVFWHSPQDLEKLQEEKGETESKIQEIERLPPGEQQQPGLIQKQELLEKKNELEKTIAEMKKADEAPKKKALPWFSFLDLLIFSLIIAALLYLAGATVNFVLPYRQDKKRIRQAYLENNYQLAIVLLYNSLSRILGLFGFAYPVLILPEDYARMVAERFPLANNDWLLLADLFLEARYSSHAFNAGHLEKGIVAYENILEGLKNNGVFWQRAILKSGFLFNHALELA